jgi:type IX secretion system PorP/SprF family membrane protein
MKRLLLFGLFIIFSSATFGQDIPLFSQKLTNSSIYNPAMAGHTFGSATFSYRSNYSGVKDAPQNYFLSLHTPFANHRFGVGANVFQEKVAALSNTYYSGSFAYHIKANKFNSFSMGIGAEFFQQNQNLGANEIYISSDPVYNNIVNNSGKPDVSFGLLYQNRFFKAGVSANRLITAWFEPSQTKLLSNYYTSFLQGSIPIREGQDLLEPYLAYRKFSEINDTFDAGLYYTYNNKITAGAAVRAGNVLNFTLGYRLNQYLMVGYSNELITSQSVGGFVGTSNEFTIRYDFNDQNYQKKFRQDYKQSLSYRRKTLNTSTIKRTPGGHSPKQLRKAQKRVAAFSPNSRYQNTKKLSMGKKTSIRKPTYTKRKAPTYKSKGRKKPTSKRRR